MSYPARAEGLVNMVIWGHSTRLDDKIRHFRLNWVRLFFLNPSVSWHPHESMSGYRHSPGQACIENRQLPMLQVFPHCFCSKERQDAIQIDFRVTAGVSRDVELSWTRRAVLRNQVHGYPAKLVGSLFSLFLLDCLSFPRQEKPVYSTIYPVQTTIAVLWYICSTPLELA